MKKIGIFFALLSFVLLFQTNSNAQSDFVKQCVANRITIGNNTYIPMNLWERPARKVQTILWILKTFEEQSPELKVVCWKIEKQQTTYLGSKIIFGIWIQHEPNKKSKK